MKYSCLLSIFIFLTACQSVEKKDGKIFHEFFGNMPGKWMMKDPTIIEKWEKDGSFYKSTVYKLHGKDSFVTEQIRVREIEGDIYYEATVRGQNHDKPVLFRLTECTKDKVVFENNAHDFPQKITYQFTGQDNLTATIQGMMNGKQQKIDFNYSRMNSAE
jgi:hypothetical protein